MMKIFTVLIGMLFVIGGFGTMAMTNEVKEYENIANDDHEFRKSNVDFTHTVLVEVGTATWCPSCPGSNYAWHLIYKSGDYDFEYCEMVIDKNTVANSHMNNYNLYWVPTSYIDGGEYVQPGTNYDNFYDFLDESGSRIVPDLVADMEIMSLGNGGFYIEYSVQNNEDYDYTGELRIYILEIESTMWDDFSGKPYNHAFLDFAVKDSIEISSGGSISDDIIWDGASEGYPNIEKDNIQFILAVTSDEVHQGYSDPDEDGDPDGAPFDAYYVDETISAVATLENNPPEAPHLEGQTNGEAGVEYSYSVCGSDPDGDSVTYFIDWGDSSAEQNHGPFPSGVCTNVSYTWAEEGTFTVKAKARDIYGAESDWATLEVTMPKSKSTNFISLSIKKPKENNLYLMGQPYPILPKGIIVIGNITVEVSAFSLKFIDKIEFYVDNVLKHTEDKRLLWLSVPWEWDEPSFFMHTLKVIAYDKSGDSTSEEIVVWKFL